MSDRDDRDDQDDQNDRDDRNDREHTDNATDRDDTTTADEGAGTESEGESPQGAAIDAGAEPENRPDEHPDTDAGEPDTHGGTEPVGQRSTAPQSDFTAGQVAFGFVVLVVGLLVTFALPLLFG